MSREEYTVQTSAGEFLFQWESGNGFASVTVTHNGQAWRKDSVTMRWERLH